ncbi:ATP-binding protein [Leptospira sp. WS92.C1]
MIQTLRLLTFGKFKDSNFDLSSSVTVFQGNNESGKTTIFDALRLAVGSKFLTASQEPKKSILSRYGEKSPDGYQIIGDVPELSKETAPQYVHCISLREGELEFAFNNEKLIKPEFLRSKLLNNGVNLEGISSNLEKIHSPKTGGKDWTAFDILKKEISELKSIRIQLIAEIESLHSRSRENTDKEKRHSQDQERILDIKKNLIQIEKESNLETKIQKKLKLLELLSEIQKLKTASETLKKNFLYSKDESSVYETSGKEIETFQKNLSASETLFKDKQNAIEIKKKELESSQNELVTLQKMKLKAEDFQEKIDKILREERFTEEIRKSDIGSAQKILGGLVAASGFLGLIGTLGALFAWNLSPIATLAGALFSAGLFGIGFYLFIQKKESLETRYSVEKEKDFVLKRSEEWNLTFRENPIPSLEKIENLRLFFSKQIENREVKARQIEFLEKEIRTLHSDADSILPKIQLEKEKILELQSGRTTWLNERKATSIQEYHRQVAEYQSLSKEISENYRKLLANHPGKTPEDLENQWKTELSMMDEIPNQEIHSEQERYFRDSKKKELQDELQSLESGLKDLNEIILKEDIRIQERLPEKENRWIETIKALAAKEREFANLESKRKSAKFAQEIIEEISKDQSFQFKLIESEISHDLGFLLPKREILFEGIDKKESIRMQDLAGEFRPIDHLSGGTLATFYLIFKLFLARKTVSKNGILLLDEPFVHLDQGRIDLALNYLKRFQEETDYQICFFTKQDELAETILKTFPKTQLISL